MVVRRVAMAMLVALAGLCCLDVQAQGVRFGSTRIAMSATPRRVPADGETFSRLRIEVRALDDVPVPDGTEVVVSTDVGDLVSKAGAKQQFMSVPTNDGYVIVLISSREAGTATVRAALQDSRNQMMIEFTPVGEGGQDSRVVRLRGDWVGYSPELNLVQAHEPGGELRYRNLVIEADRLQLNPETLVARAYGQVRLKRNDAELECEDVYIELTTMRGTCRMFGDLGVEESSFNAFTLKPLETEQDLPEGAYRFDEREGQMWMVARSVAIFPGEKIVLRNAKLYIGPQKVMRFPPYWVIGFEGYRGSTNSNFLEVDSTHGVAIDFPFFLSVTDTMSHAVKVRKGATAGSIMARDTWNLAYEFAYSQPNQEAEGVFTIDGFPRPDWGASWRETRKLLGDLDTSLSIAWPDHQSIFTDFNVYRYGKAGHLSVRTHGDRLTGTGDWSYGMDANFLSAPTPWGSALDVRWGTGLQAGRDAWLDEGFVFEHQMSGYLDFTSLRPGGDLTITPSISDTYTWDTEQRRSNIARMQLAFNRRFGRGVNANLRYALEHRSGTERYFSLATNRGIDQNISLNLSAYASQKWNAYANAHYGITDGDLYGFGALNYRPIRKWRVGVVGSYYEFSNSSFHDMELSLNRAIGAREVGVRWSRADDRLSLVFGTAGF